MNVDDDVVLVVDDDPAVARVLVALLGQAGVAAQSVPSAEAALDALSRRPFDVVITDLRMPGMDGLGLLDQITHRWSEVPVIVLTAHGTVSGAVDALKRGAADYLLKPFDREEVIFAVRKALLRAEHDATESLRGLQSADGFAGGSTPMQECMRLLGRAAPSSSTVLLRGETGVGKDVAARWLHAHGPRAGGPFVKVHCAAFPDALLESELFGYERGAFTGAAARKPGRVDLARGGTLFLDEIGDVKPATQVKLLQLLQDRTYERLGGTETLEADVRFVSATHRDLEAMIRAGEFREDLFYRLSVLPIWLPPLRERPDDLEQLATRFAVTLAAAQGRPPATLSVDALAVLRAQRWPGNVRQLQNFVERLVVLSDGPVITAEDVRRELARQPAPAEPAASGERVSQPGERTSDPGSRSSSPGDDGATLAQRRRQVERDAILEALRQAGDNRTVAARILGLSRRTFYNKLHEHDIS